MNKLDKWYKQFEEFPKLSFKEAKEKYLHALTMPEDKKNEEIKEIILGTMHCVYSYIKRHELEKLSVPSCDIDDIINTIVEEWIIKIKRGKLLSTSFYSSLITRVRYDFYKTSDNNISSIYYKRPFIELFKIYIKLKNENEYLTFEEFIKSDLIKNNIDKYNSESEFIKHHLDLFEAFEKIYDYVKLKNCSDNLFIEDNLKSFFDLINEIQITEYLTNDTLSYTMEDDIITKADLLAILKNLKNRRRLILYKHHIEGITLEELANEYNRTTECIRIIETKAFQDSKDYIEKRINISKVKTKKYKTN